MKIVKQLPTTQNFVVAVRCDRCGYTIAEGDAGAGRGTQRLEFDSGRNGELYAGDYCDDCGAELQALLVSWRPYMRVVAAFNEETGYRVYAYEMLEAETQCLIAVRSVYDEPEFR